MSRDAPHDSVDELDGLQRQRLCRCALLSGVLDKLARGTHRAQALRRAERPLFGFCAFAQPRRALCWQSLSPAASVVREREARREITSLQRIFCNSLDRRPPRRRPRRRSARSVSVRGDATRTPCFALHGRFQPVRSPGCVNPSAGADRRASAGRPSPSPPAPPRRRASSTSRSTTSSSRARRTARRRARPEARRRPARRARPLAPRLAEGRRC